MNALTPYGDLHDPTQENYVLRLTDGEAYYQADDAASLAMAFDSIGSAVLSCTYTLTGSPDIDSMFIRFDGTDVPRDTTHMNGWDYDPTTNELVFFGSACDSLRTGTVTDLVVGAGCSVGRTAPPPSFTSSPAVAQP